MTARSLGIVALTAWLFATAPAQAGAEAKAVHDMSAAELMEAERSLRAPPPVPDESASRPVRSVTIRKDRDETASMRVREAGAVRRYLDEVIAVDLVDEPLEAILHAVAPAGWSARVQVKRPDFSEKLFSVTAENRRGEILATIQRATGLRFSLYPSLYLVLVTD